ncbi:MAG: AI-2E family transporter [Candidatus Cloacimonadaceae bacterium]
MIEHSKELRWIRILLTIIAIPVIVLILKTLKSIFIPLVFAVFLSYVLAPLAGYLRRKNVHIYLIMLTMIVIILLFSLGLIVLLTSATSSLISGFPKYQERLILLVQNGVSGLENLTARMDIAFSSIPGFDISQMIAPGNFNISKAISDVMTTTFGISWNFFLIVVFLLFMIAQGNQLQLRLKNVMDSTQHQKTSTTLANIQKQIRRYLLTKSIISLCSAVILMILMWLYGVDFILICGILLFIMSFIPNVGSIIANSIPVLVCLLQSGFDVRFFSFLLLIIANELLVANMIEPKIQGNKMNLSPITILISLIFWGWVWGIVGMILAVPITSAINIILLQLDEKNVISAIISGNS